MKKNIAVLTFVFFLFACSKEQEKYPENHAISVQYAQKKPASKNKMLIAADMVITDPKIIFKCSYKTTLPHKIRQLINEYDPDFSIWQEKVYDPKYTDSCAISKKQTPYILQKDFNGDGHMDAALSGKSNDEFVVIVLLSNKIASYEIFELLRRQYSNDSSFSHPVLFLVEKGSSYEYGDMVVHAFTLKNDAVAIKYRINGIWEKSIYYWNSTNQNFLIWESSYE